MTPRHHLNGLHITAFDASPIHTSVTVKNSDDITVAAFWCDTTEAALQLAKKFIADNAPVVTVQKDDLADFADTYIAKGGAA